jgi:aryl-alcohol dehydrogenase-like predicted oxidoreductase
MLTRTIPVSGESVPVVGLGTWQTFDVGDGSRERAPLEAVLREFAVLGGRVVDSSPMYGRAEEVAGDLMAKLGLREKLFVATKVWISGKHAGLEQMNASLRKLRADPIDLLQVHNLVDVATHLDTLRGWKREGRVRYLGVTHYTVSGAEAIARLLATEMVDFVQINYSVAEREAEQRLLPLLRARHRRDRQPAVCHGGVAPAAADSTAATVGGRTRVHYVGAASSEVRRVASGDHVRDSGDVERRASARQLESRRGPDARRGNARAHRG